MLVFASALRWAAAATPEVAATAAQRDDIFKREQARIELVNRLSPTIVCVSDEKQRGGGSGVLIDADGVGLTNYHVVSSFLTSRKGLGGMADGKSYELEVLGIDPTGDVAMFRLIRDEPFAFAELGDSDTLRLGDPVIAMGNPFSLSEDFTPTVTMGMVTGLHRYQWGSGDTLIYSDCIQVDASINPGSSGGPLFDAQGRIVGINGRISVSPRGRLNVGFAYAISINQIKRFMPSMYAGLLAKHGTLQATVEDRDEQGVIFNQVMRHASAYIAGVRIGDRLLALDGINIASRNHLASLIGTYPADWPVHLRVQREDTTLEFWARLEGITPKKTAQFQVNQGVNVRRTQLILSRFADLVMKRPARSSTQLGSPDAAAQRAWPSSWQWNMKREYEASPDGTRPAEERFRAGQVGDGPIRITQQFDDGTFGRVIEFTDAATHWRRSADADSLEKFELPMEQAMVLRAVYVLLRRLGNNPTVNDLYTVNHLGGYALLPASAQGTAVSSNSEFTKPILTELIEWPLGPQLSAKLAVEVDTFRVIRISVLDAPSGQEAVIDLSDYRDAGELVWPHRFDVRVGGLRYRETWSDLRINLVENGR